MLFLIGQNYDFPSHVKIRITDEVHKTAYKTKRNANVHTITEPIWASIAAGQTLCLISRSLMINYTSDRCKESLRLIARICVLSVDIFYLVLYKYSIVHDKNIGSVGIKQHNNKYEITIQGVRLRVQNKCNNKTCLWSQRW